MKIIGYGGGKGDGGSGRVAQEAPDSLRSKAFAKVLDLISEGEIEGLVDGAKSIYLDYTPLQNADNSFNFSGVSWASRTGTQAQSSIPNFGSVENTVTVNTEITKASPVTRTYSNTNLDALIINIGIPQLTLQDKTNGDINGTSVQIQIDVQSNGGGFITQVFDGADVFRGKTTSRYQRSLKIALTGSAPWDVRITRITPDSVDSATQNKTYWDTTVEVIDAKMRYPNSALIGISCDASQFQSIPSRAYDMKLLRIRVPTNYNPITRAYTGSWDGTFKIAWTDNPAWCFYDLLTTKRYGLGSFISESQVDKWGLYAIAQYCDGSVPNGFGGTEPRFTCNLYLQSKAEAYKVINDMASVFRGMAYWASGSVTAVQDAPNTATYLYNQSNVVDGIFNYSGSSAKARHTVALVTWNDPADFYRQKVEYVEDTLGIARYGVVSTEVAAVGCTSRGQANRVGRWLLFTERLETETVQFKTGLEGMICRPGQVIKIADSARAGVRRGGRLVSATTSALVIDSPVTLDASAFTLSVLKNDGTSQSSTVTNGAGTWSTLNVSPALSQAPVAGSVWVLSNTAVTPQTFRVLSVNETEKHEFEVVALAHEPGKFDSVETGLTLQPRTISALTLVPAAPTGGTLTEYLYEGATDLKTMITLSVNAVAGATLYRFSYRRDDGNFIDLPASNTPIVNIEDAIPGFYTISVKAGNEFNYNSQPLTYTATVLGKTAPPADVTGLQVQVQNGSGILSWDTATDLDVRIGGKILVRYTSDVSDLAAWNTSIPIAELSGSATSGIIPLLNGTYLAKFQDSSGNTSVNASRTLTSLASVLQYNVVVTNLQNPAFAGTKTNMVAVAGNLQLAQTFLFDDIVDFDAFTDPLDSGIQPFGEYAFNAPIDIGAIYTCRVSQVLTVASYNANNLVDAWVSVDALTDIDASIAGDSAVVRLYISTTPDNPTGSPTWSDWKLFSIGDYSARGFRFRIEVERGDNPNQQVSISALGAVIDVPDRIESASAVSIPAAPTTITFAKEFYAVPAVAATAQNMATGDYIAITGKTTSGFTIEFKNAAGTSVARTVDWIAKGFGYKT